MRIGFEARQHGDEAFPIERRVRAERRGADRRRRIGDEVQQRVHQPRRRRVVKSAERGDRLQTSVRLGVGRLNDLQERRNRRRIADAPGRADRFDEDRPIAARQKRQEHRQRGAILERAQPFDGERPGVRVGVFRQRHERRLRARVFEALQRKRHRPPVHARLAGRVEHGGRERTVRLQTHERIDPEPKGRSRGVRPRVFIRARRLRERAGLHDLRHHPADRVCRARIAEETERLGGASLHERRRVGERRHERIARLCVAEESEREGGHLTDFRVGIGEQRDERSGALGKADTSDRQRRAAPHACLLIRQQPHEIGRRRRQHDGRRLAPSRGRCRRGRDGRRHVAQHALILQPENPRHLLLEGRPGGTGRRHGRAGTRHGAQRQRQSDDRTTHVKPQKIATDDPTGRACTRSMTARRSVACSTRDSTMDTPSPGPSGTPIVPSAATSMGGSIRSGLK